ncbi:hypothetical protein G9A89_002705 [Geosiphon pyriformis]|nr:hypothetical protein G9A89_002705 [Geosiphon pyriformis]
MEEANCTKLVNLAIGETSSAAEEKIDQFTKKQSQRYQPLQKRNQNNFTLSSNNQSQKIAESYNETNKIEVINITSHHSNFIINHHHQLTIYQDPNIKPIQQQYQQPPTQHYQVSARRLITQNQFTPQN